MNSFHTKNLNNFSEINYLIDSENFISENKHINFSKFNKNSIILFEYTSDFYQTKLYLETQNIKHTILTDNLDLEFIIIE
tara:strand:+ start:284 stop:523 length:240 start_codon:yes stop_codon:yes gene_type:complete